MGVDEEKGACGDGDGDECGSIDMADISTLWLYCCAGHQTLGSETVKCSAKGSKVL